MKNMVLFFSVFLMFAQMASGKTGYASPDIPEAIPISFKAGNAKELSKFFNENIELVILGKEDVYSKSQAEQILKDFFDQHKPTSFTILFEGGKETSKYAIGSLKTSAGNYRVYFLIKKQNGATLIHRLRIEEEDEQNL